MRIATPKPTLDTLPPADVRYSVPRPVFPQSHSPRDCDATTEDQEEVKIWQWWDKHITASLRLPEGYRQVHVLMIKWMDEIDTSETRDEV